GVTLNAALDEAVLGDTVNNALSTAQNIDSSFISIGGAASRGAVVGTPSLPVGPDYYSFSLSAGDAITLALQSLGASPVHVALQDSGGTTLAAGTAGSVNGENVVSDFVVSTTGTYYAQVTGGLGTGYNLAVLRNADLASGTNTSLAAAQPLLGGFSGAAYALGNLQLSTTTITFTELPPQPVNGVSLEGVTFGFTVGGVPSTDATFGGGGPGTTMYTTPPQ